MILKIDDKVLWKGAWGTKKAQKVSIKSIEFLTDKRHKNSGTDVDNLQSINWELVVDWCIVDFNENANWAYGYQIKPID